MSEKDTIGSDITVLESILSPEMRLVKKYLLDSEGKLKLYHPVTQKVMFEALKEGILEEIVKYDAEKRAEKKCK